MVIAVNSDYQRFSNLKETYRRDWPSKQCRHDFFAYSNSVEFAGTINQRMVCNNLEMLFRSLKTAQVTSRDILLVVAWMSDIYPQTTSSPFAQIIANRQLARPTLASFEVSIVGTFIINGILTLLAVR